MQVRFSGEYQEHHQLGFWDFCKSCHTLVQYLMGVLLWHQPLILYLELFIRCQEEFKVTKNLLSDPISLKSAESLQRITNTAMLFGELVCNMKVGAFIRGFIVEAKVPLLPRLNFKIFYKPFFWVDLPSKKKKVVTSPISIHSCFSNGRNHWYRWNDFYINTCETHGLIFREGGKITNHWQIMYEQQ